MTSPKNQRPEVPETRTSSKRRDAVRPRKNASASDRSERAVYDGLRLLGSYAPAKGGFAAFDRNGKRLGNFADAASARDAILAGLGPSIQ